MGRCQPRQGRRLAWERITPSFFSARALRVSWRPPLPPALLPYHPCRRVYERVREMNSPVSISRRVAMAMLVGSRIPQIEPGLHPISCISPCAVDRGGIAIRGGADGEGARPLPCLYLIVGTCNPHPTRPSASSPAREGRGQCVAIPGEIRARGRQAPFEHRQVRRATGRSAGAEEDRRSWTAGGKPCMVLLQSHPVLSARDHEQRR